MSKSARDGFVQSSKDLVEAREKVFNSIMSTMVKTASKVDKKEEKTQDKIEKKDLKFREKMEKKEAEGLGFFKLAKNCGFGVYQIADLDGGQGSIWFLDKAEDGQDYLVKQIDSAGEVVRRMKTASASISK